MDRTRPTHAFIAMRPCGCLGLSAADMPALRADAAEMLARAVIAGLQPGYIPMVEVGQRPWSCVACAVVVTADDAAPQVIATPGSNEPLWLVQGEISYIVTVPIRLVVQAADEDAAQEHAWEHYAPTVLAVDSELIEVESRYDSPTVTPYEVPIADQARLPL